MEGDEDDGGDMDDFEEEFQIKSPTKQKPPHEPVNFDVYSVRAQLDSIDPSPLISHCNCSAIKCL